MKPGHFVALFLAVAFSLATVTSLYAADSWFVIKDKKGVCKVIKAKDKTPTTIDNGGPFKTKKEAKEARDKLCPKGASSTLGKIKEKVKSGLKKGEEKVKSELKKGEEKVKPELEKMKEKVQESMPSEKK